MSVALLCVQFRNVLPSEELLRFARALWSDLQHGGAVAVTGDGTLCITQRPAKLAPFEVELTVEGSRLRGLAEDSDPLVAVQGAFAQLGSWRDLGPIYDAALLGNNAPLSPTASLPDTALET